MSSELPSSNKQTSKAHLDLPPQFLEGRSSPTYLPTNYGNTSGILSFSGLFPQPADVHIHESSPSIKGYLDIVPPVNCSSTSGNAASASNANRKKTSENVTSIGEPSSPGVTALQRVPRRIWSAFFVYFVSL